MRIGIAISRYNDVVSVPLLEGALEALEHLGADTADIQVAWVPGAFEIPIAARELAARGDVDAVVCLGAVIRGDTAHFEYVAGEAARGIASVHLTTGVPATFGVLTVDTLEQALDRAGGKHGNKGAEAATTAVEMVVLLRALRAPGRAAQRTPS
jgi:6,7-dimethyl-8-ribityllumazine synthase